MGIRTSSFALGLGILAACSKAPPPAEPASPSAQPSAQPSAPPATAPTAAPAAGGLLAVGAPAPAMKVTAHDGSAVDLGTAGKPYVIYFYPKDDTPGCTVQAQGVRELWPEFVKLSVPVYGVSLDDTASHTAFATKHELPFPLLADTDGAIAKSFGVPVSGGYAKRVTFVVGKDAKIAHVIPDVSPKEHADQVLTMVKAL